MRNEPADPGPPAPSTKERGHGWCLSRSTRWRSWLHRGKWIAALALTLATSSASPPVALSGQAMGTTWSVKFIQPEPALAISVLERDVAARLEQLEQIFSTYRNQSELSRFNAAACTTWIPVSAELAEVAEKSRQISELTGGAFDVTIYPLVELWGFGARGRSGPPPSRATIAAARALVDWRQLEVRSDPPELRKARPTLRVDFSSMAKGFAADQISTLLQQRGATNHLVQIGGDIKSGGPGPGGEGWRTAVEEPRNDAAGIAARVRLSGEALSTSGDYRNFFMIGGRRYGHILDPRSGEPAKHAAAAVSVVCASCAQSSALATALFVLGPDEGWRLARAQQWPCVFFVRRGDEFLQRATPEFERLRH